MENAEGRVQSTGFFQTQNPRYLAFQLNLDIVFLGAYLKRANGIKQTTNRLPSSPTLRLTLFQPCFLCRAVKTVQEDVNGLFQFLAINSIPALKRNASKKLKYNPTILPKASHCLTSHCQLRLSGKLC